MSLTPLYFVLNTIFILVIIIIFIAVIIFIMIVLLVAITIIIIPYLLHDHLFLTHSKPPPSAKFHQLTTLIGVICSFICSITITTITIVIITIICSISIICTNAPGDPAVLLGRMALSSFAPLG